MCLAMGYEHRLKYLGLRPVSARRMVRAPSSNEFLHLFIFVFHRLKGKLMKLSAQPSEFHFW